MEKGLSELKKIISAVRQTLEDGGVKNVILRLPVGDRYRYSEPVVTVGLADTTEIKSVNVEYLGEKYDAETGESPEVYGKKAEVTLGIRIYSPVGEKYGAEGCAGVFDDILSALEDMPEGLRVLSLSIGETKFDRNSGMLMSYAVMKLSAYLYAEKAADGEFLDFNLKGVLK